MKINFGTRKFIAFVLSLFVYTALVIMVVVKLPSLIVDLSVFVVQLAMGIVIIVGAFFASNVAEHFSNNVKKET